MGPDLLDIAFSSSRCRALGIGERDREDRRRTGSRGERFRRGDALVWADLGGEPLRMDVGDRRRSRERDLACREERLRLLSRPDRLLYGRSLESSRGVMCRLPGLLGDSSRLDLLSGEIDLFLVRPTARL